MVSPSGFSERFLTKGIKKTRHEYRGAVQGYGSIACVCICMHIHV